MKKLKKIWDRIKKLLAILIICLVILALCMATFAAFAPAGLSLLGGSAGVGLAAIGPVSMTWMGWAGVAVIGAGAAFIVNEEQSRKMVDRFQKGAKEIAEVPGEIAGSAAKGVLKGASNALGLPRIAIVLLAAVGGFFAYKIFIEEKNNG